MAGCCGTRNRKCRCDPCICPPTLRADLCGTVGTTFAADLHLVDSAGDPYDGTGADVTAGMAPAAGLPPVGTVTVTEVDATEGHYLLTVDSDGWPAAGCYVWDVAVVDNNGTWRPVAGCFQVCGSVAAEAVEPA